MKQELIWHIKPGSGQFGSEPRHEYIIRMLRALLNFTVYEWVGNRTGGVQP